MTEPTKLWWLSFAEDKPPKGRGFRGVVLMWAPTFGQAYERVNQLAINPGGEVLGKDAPPDVAMKFAKLDASWFGRVLTKEECDEVSRLALGPDDPEAQCRSAEGVCRVCLEEEGFQRAPEKS